MEQDVIQGESDLQEPEDSVVYESEEIVIYSLFQSSIMNPDAEMAVGENIASLELKNISGQHIEVCEIDLTTTEGELYQFMVEDIPNDMMVMTFEISNKELLDDVTVESVTCEARLITGDVLMQGQVVFTVHETEIQLKNIGKMSLENVTVNCHDLLDGEYFGGKKYEYGGINISPGETVVIDAMDCFLGEAGVSSIMVR